MTDKLRICKVNNFKAPVGTHVTFQGNEIGHVIDNKDDYCEIAINSDIVNSWIRNDKCSFSLEVVRK